MKRVILPLESAVSYKSKIENEIDVGTETPIRRNIAMRHIPVAIPTECLLLKSKHLMYQMLSKISFKNYMFA